MTVLITVAPSFRWVLTPAVAVGCLFTAAVGGKARRRSPDECVDPDRIQHAITVRVAHTEMGQGIHTLAVNLVAEELRLIPVRYK